MRPAVLIRASFYTVVLGLFLDLPAQAQTPKTFKTLPVRRRFRPPACGGVAYTVFEGTRPESMNVEVLGVLKNVNGPKGDVILVRLSGTKVEYTGVVAGMSGSPVYLDGRLAGAIAFRIGEFSKEPIAGVTPIGEMLEINAMDQTPENPPVGGLEASAERAQQDLPVPATRVRFFGEFRQLSEAHRNSSGV